MTVPIDFRVLLLDIEGTITPIDFVYNTLFPFARLHLREFVDQHYGETAVEDDLAALKVQYQTDIVNGLTPPLWPDTSIKIPDIETYVYWLMDHDRKVAPLKSLQGKIWTTGYESGALRARIFVDVLPAFRRLHMWNIPIYLFSSGSVLAQQLLIRYSEFGDLSEYIRGYFDTTIGSKLDARGYATIAETIDVMKPEVLFVSDIVGELDAAFAAGMKVLLSQRPGNFPQPESAYGQVTSFESLCAGSAPT